MAKTVRKTITSRKTEARDDTMKAPGCQWEFGGAIGLSKSLCVFEAGNGVGGAGDLPDSERIALANYMIDLWTQFRVWARTSTAAMTSPAGSRTPAAPLTASETTGRRPAFSSPRSRSL